MTNREDMMDNFRAIDIIEGFEEADDQDMVDAFQHLINSGLVWQLQGSYGRTAAALIREGVCHDAK